MVFNLRALAFYLRSKSGEQKQMWVWIVVAVIIAVAVVAAVYVFNSTQPIPFWQRKP